MSEHTVTVAVDPKLHTREPASESERLTWAVLDTTWNLLREYSVRLTLEEIREQNPGFPDDATLFEQAKPYGGPETYLDLAPEHPLAAAGLAGALDLLQDQARADAVEGLGMEVREG